MAEKRKNLIDPYTFLPTGQAFLIQPYGASGWWPYSKLEPSKAPNPCSNPAKYWFCCGWSLNPAVDSHDKTVCDLWTCDRQDLPTLLVPFEVTKVSNKLEHKFTLCSYSAAASFVTFGLLHELVPPTTGILGSINLNLSMEISHSEIYSVVDAQRAASICISGGWAWNYTN